jgi:NAD(P) transhydrogenase subunit beta
VNLQETTAEEVGELLAFDHSVVIAPGYGMAAAEAHHSVAALVRHLRERGVHVRFAIHPAAGRVPGHMYRLLADAKVPEGIVLGMDAINDDFARTEVVLAIGAHDTVNLAAAQDSGSPMAGMPVLRVWQAEYVIVVKRSTATGYAGVHNPLLFRDNSRILLGDARTRVGQIIQALDPACAPSREHPDKRAAAPARTTRERPLTDAVCRCAAAVAIRWPRGRRPRGRAGFFVVTNTSTARDLRHGSQDRDRC